MLEGTSIAMLYRHLLEIENKIKNKTKQKNNNNKKLLFS